MQTKLNFEQIGWKWVLFWPQHFWGQWGSGGVGGRRMNPKPIKTLSCKEQSPTQKLLGRAFSHSPKFFCSPSIIVVVVLIRNLKSAETQGHPTINFDSPKNNNKAWMKLSGATLSILGECWGKIICSSLLARLLEVFSARMVHLQPATWLTGKFPSRRRHTLLAGLGVVIGKNSVTVDYYRHLTNYLWKSITFRRIGEWLSIFIDWLSQSISLNRFLLIILIEINYWFSLIGIDLK